MPANPPPVPPEQRSPKGSGAAPENARKPDPAQDVRRDRDRNLAEQGRQGNVKQNTTNKGYQQDR